MSYQIGQCTWGAALKAPWISESAVGILGDAHSWATRAANKGLKVGNAPQVGSVVCFQPGVDEAGPVGHVAFVTGVNANGTFNIIEWDFKYPGSAQSDNRTNLQVKPGVSFIYAPQSNKGGTFVLSTGFKQGLWRLVFQALLFREPHSGDELNGWVTNTASDGSNFDVLLQNFGAEWSVDVSKILDIMSKQAAIDQLPTTQVQVSDLEARMGVVENKLVIVHPG